MNHLTDTNVASILQINLLLHSTRLVGFFFSFQRIECQIGMAVRAKRDMSPTRVSRDFNLIYIRGLHTSVRKKHAVQMGGLAHFGNAMHKELGSCNGVSGG
jgi:hypothetical protein